MMRRTEQSAKGYDLMQPLDTLVCFRLSRRVMHGEKQACHQLHKKQREGYSAEAVKVVDPSWYRFIKHSPVPAGKSQPDIKIIKNSHRLITVTEKDGCRCVFEICYFFVRMP